MRTNTRLVSVNGGCRRRGGQETRLQLPLSSPRCRSFAHRTYPVLKPKRRDSYQAPTQPSRERTSPMGGVDRVCTVGNPSSFFDRSEGSGPFTEGWLQTKVNKSDWGGCARKKLNQPNLAWHFQFLGLIGSAQPNLNIRYVLLACGSHYCPNPTNPAGG
jgi:hypothetical protein